MAGRSNPARLRMVKHGGIRITEVENSRDMFETCTVYRRIVTLSGSKLCSLTIASCPTYANMTSSLPPEIMSYP